MVRYYDDDADADTAADAAADAAATRRCHAEAAGAVGGCAAASHAAPAAMMHMPVGTVVAMVPRILQDKMMIGE